MVFDEETLHIQVEHLPCGIAHVGVRRYRDRPGSHDLEYRRLVEQPVARPGALHGVLGSEHFTGRHDAHGAAVAIEYRQC
ncbi:MAG TPA: hypothetical protein VM736_15755 [Gemmatimonadales bacterium]|nr:hypothetical protein [Gemmatimonadales bacterium]